MGSLTNAAEVDLLRMLTGQATSIFTTTPYTPWLALFTAAPSDSAAGTEATGGGYARVNTAGLWGAPSSGSPGQVQNSAQVAFAAFTGAVSAGAPFVAFGLFTAVTGGSLTVYGDLGDPTKTGAAADQIVFPAAALTVTAD